MARHSAFQSLAAEWRLVGALHFVQRYSGMQRGAYETAKGHNNSLKYNDWSVK
jgi:hypothetical protein